MRPSIFEPGPRKRAVEQPSELNLRALLTAIASNPGHTAAEASRLTGFSPSTVSRLLDELLHRGLVIEGELLRGRRGQPGRSLHLNSEGALSAGCEIRSGTSYMFLRSLTGETLAETEFTLSGVDPATAAAEIHGVLVRLLGSVPPALQKRLVGLGIAAPIDMESCPRHAAGAAAPVWRAESVLRSLKGLPPVAVDIYPTATAAAWAELARTPPPRPADYLYLFVGDCLQSSLLLDGRPWKAPDRRQEAMGRSMIMLGGDPVRLYDLLEPLTRPGVETDPDRERLLERGADALAAAIQPVVETLGLPLVILDGPERHQLLDDLVQRVRDRLVSASWAAAPEVRRGTAGGRGPALGAALRPIYLSLFSDEPW